MVDVAGDWGPRWAKGRRRTPGQWPAPRGGNVGGPLDRRGL